MLLFPTACHAVYSAARSRGPGGTAVAEYGPVAGAIHPGSRGKRARFCCAGIERARFDERGSHSKAEANGEEDADDS